MKSISGKIFFNILLFITSFTGLILFITFSTIQKDFRNNNIKEMKIHSILISEYCFDLLNVQDSPLIKSKLNNFSKLTQIQFSIFDINGKIITKSDNNQALKNNDSIISEINTLKDSINHQNNPPYKIIESGDDIIISVLISKDNEIKGILKSYMKLNFMGAIYNYLKIDIFALSALIFTFSFLFVIIFSFKVLNPIRELAKASRKVALGDFDNKVPIKGNDELSNLASNFNQMTEKLQGYFILAEAQQEQYLRLITSIQTGMIVIDRNGKIIMNNKSFENIIGSNIVQGHEYWEFLSQLDFKDLLETVLKKKKHTNREIEIQNNFYLCSANYIESKNEFVVLFHDISEIKKLENIKRDFVVNVTHELRTPLTAIKGYIETLEDEINDNSESANYIGIIKRHTDRLINIVQDLLTLSEIEQKTSNIELSKVDINILFENMYRIFEQKIQQKGLQFIIKPDKSIPYLKLDSFRIEQVLINLIDNAIKYTDSGYVKLEAVKKGAKIQLIISDTGLGIPKEHHSRLFERFYTVDKSRSRKVGGTGLGLSIVKHIIMLHKGEIYVDSNSGKGTKFIIEIPQKHFKKFI